MHNAETSLISVNICMCVENGRREKLWASARRKIYRDDGIVCIRRILNTLGKYTVDESKLKRDPFAQLLLSGDIKEKILHNENNSHDLIAAW